MLPNSDYVSLSKLGEIELEGFTFDSFQYDHISDDMITEALTDSRLAQVDPKLDWESDSYLYHEDSIPEGVKHAYRVAALVRTIKNEGFTIPVEFDTMVMGRCLSCIFNGHHRIRAMQYLKEDVVPFSMSGDLDLLEPLLLYAGVPGMTPTLYQLED